MTVLLQGEKPAISTNILIMLSCFLKESSQTNERNIIESQKKVIDRYSNDHDEIYEYRWAKGSFLAKYKIKNGIIVKPKNDIKVSDIPNR